MDTDFSPIADRVQGIARDMFNMWTKNALKDYPGYNYSVIDESILVQDLKAKIESTLSAIKKEKHSNTEWRIHFFQGFLQEILNGHWYHEYITRQSSEYKGIIILKAIKEYIKYDDAVKDRIEKMYDHLLKKNLNITAVDTAIENSYQSVMSNLMIGVAPEAENQDAITVFLDNLLTEKIDKLAKKDNPNYLPEIGLYLQDEEIKNLILQNSI